MLSTMPFSTVGSGLLNIGSAISNYLAPSTWVDNNAAWKSWCGYLDAKGQVSTLISEQLILSFLDHLITKVYY